ncbi:MAG: polysaccharide biosynthesis C-terminal domain-containing protein [Firmicutes bacterium]|nr:polysaccharide biosynthesis C-terminal domain-containing protein [Bacillota bacterium]
MPLLSKHRANNEIAKINYKINYALKLIFLIVLPSSLVIYFYSDEISYFLYRGLSRDNLEIMSGLLKISSVSVIFLSLTQVCVSILIAIKKIYIGIISLTFAIIIKIALNLIFLNFSDLNIYGPAIASVVCYAVGAMICFLYIIFYTKCGFKITTKIVIPAIISFVSVFSVYFFRKFIFNFESGVSFLSALGLTLVFFLLLAFLFKILNKNDFKKLHF